LIIVTNLALKEYLELSSFSVNRPENCTEEADGELSLDMQVRFI
jgi:hypothetical protein